MIEFSRKKYSIKVSNQTAYKVVSYLHRMLEDADMIRRYDYSFDLGKTKDGTNLGQGDVCIRYYNDSGFARLQGWEETIWEGALAIAHEEGEYDYHYQGWNHADMVCQPPLYADMEQRRHNLSDADMQLRRVTPSPHSQQSFPSRKLSNARGTQAKPTLALRARLVQFLAGGEGTTAAIGGITAPIGRPQERPAEYVQGELFCKDLYTGY